MSLLTKLQAAQDVLSTLVRPTHSGITSGELMSDPANWHGHQGNNDIFVLTKQGVDFQLFRSHDDVTFIYGKDDAASYWGGGNNRFTILAQEPRCDSASSRLKRSTCTGWSMTPLRKWFSIMLLIRLLSLMVRAAR